MNRLIFVILIHNLCFISSQRFVIYKKCCIHGEYFNITKLTCETTKHITLPYKIEFNGVPDCGNDLYLSTRKFSNYYKAINSVNVTEDYCFDYSEKESIIVTCSKKSTNRPTLTKCCPYGQGVTKGSKCVDDVQNFQLKFYNLDKKLTPNDGVTLADFDIHFGDPCGDRGKYNLDPYDEKEKSYVGTNGNLYSEYFNQDPYNKSLVENDFCLDYIANKSEENLILTFVCFPETETIKVFNVLLIGICLIISCVFLLATFLVYVCSPKRRNFYGKTLMCYVASLFVAYVCLAAAKLDESNLDERNGKICSGIGYCILFAFLAAFAWLNVMSIDIWKTFRKVRQRQQRKSETKTRFLLYSLYAWGLPLIITGICIFIDRIEYFSTSVIKPDIGEKSCWFSPDKYGIHVFFIAPISVVITSNIIMYLMTAWKCWRVKREINRMGNHCKNKFSANKDQFILNGKLFIVMGVNWSLEIISFFLPHSLWYVTDLANALHGLFLFVIFILKKKVLRDFLESLTILHKRLKRISNPYSIDVLTEKNGYNPRILRNSTTSTSVYRTTSTFNTN